MGAEDLTKKYVERINEELAPQRNAPELSSRQYQEFKAQYLPRHLSFYEKACNFSAKILNVAPNPKDRPKIEEAIRVCHLGTTPEGIVSFALLAPVTFILLVLLGGFLVPVLLGSSGSLFIAIFGLVAGVSMILTLQKLPYFLANSWRMKASNQMVLCTFYIVTYMRHTSNLELAIDFAGEHLAPPLSLDMKKVIWDLETEKFESVKESLDDYLDRWKDWNPEFIESMHLIEASLLESSETRRVEMLDKSLSVMLDETYEKMLHYAHNLKSPLTTLHMLGVILPILGLVILPLMVSFIEEARWYHMAIVYNITLPLMVYLLAKSILSTRPTGYGNTDISELNPELKKYKTLNIPLGGKDVLRLSPMIVSVLIIGAFFFLAFFPLVYHAATPENDWVVTQDYSLVETTFGSEEHQGAKFYLLDYRQADPANPDSAYENGPFGVGAVLLSLLIPLGLGIGIGMYYALRTKNVLKIREETAKLEQEFASALFQLGNRLADGIPVEIAFSKVAEVLSGTNTGKFFDIVTTNITKLNMNVEAAIFDPQRGALLSYPSNIIESSMKVLVESSKKGPLIASQAVINVSEYIKQMHRVDERLKDLMSDVISSMKSQISFLTPVIAGIVIGITSMISSILGTIGTKLAQLGTATGGLGTSSDLLDTFGKSSIPTFHFQVIVGLYVVQITYILTVMVNGVENGYDELSEEAMLGKSLSRSIILYAAISAITIILFGSIAGQIANV